MAEVRSIYSENVPAIGVGSVYRVWGANLRLGNVPDTTAVDDIFFGWGRSIYHEQLHFKGINSCDKIVFYPNNVRYGSFS